MTDSEISYPTWMVIDAIERFRKESWNQNVLADQKQLKAIHGP
jgi:hypothetical protein